MKTPLNPASIAAPLGLYTHGIVTEGPGRWLHVSGQVGVRPDGTIPQGFAEQVEVAWTNLLAVLAEAGMGVEDLVKVTTFVVDEADLPALGPVRARFLGQARPASTLVVARALARPEWRVEVEASAFRGT
jgi:2-iminobutanoate/2-iminopropanoate deaminase